MSTSDIETLVARAIASLATPSGDATAAADVTMRERFNELGLLALGNLFPRMPFTGQIYDRTTLVRITEGLDDNDAAGLGKRTDDWMRLEGIIKQEEGKRAYFLPLRTQAIMSLPTPSGLLGDVCATILKRYAESTPSAETRKATQALGAAVFRLFG